MNIWIPPPCVAASGKRSTVNQPKSFGDQSDGGKEAAPGPGLAVARDTDPRSAAAQPRGGDTSDSERLDPLQLHSVFPAQGREAFVSLHQLFYKALRGDKVWLSVHFDPEIIKKK